jgi:hypothetical protein
VIFSTAILLLSPCVLHAQESPVFRAETALFTAPTDYYAQLSATFAAVRDSHSNGGRTELHLPPKRTPQLAAAAPGCMRR